MVSSEVCWWRSGGGREGTWSWASWRTRWQSLAFDGFCWYHCWFPRLQRGMWMSLFWAFDGDIIYLCASDFVCHCVILVMSMRNWYYCKSRRASVRIGFTFRYCSMNGSLCIEYCFTRPLTHERFLCVIVACRPSWFIFSERCHCWQANWIVIL